MVEAVVGFIGDGVGVFWTVSLHAAVLTIAVTKPLGSVSAGAVAVGEIATLNHEIIDDTMEDGTVVITVFDEEFEVLNVGRSCLRIEFNGHRAAVGAAIPRQFQINDVGGGVGSVGQVDHGKDEDSGQEYGHDAGRRRGTFVEKARETGFADAFVLHFIEQFIVSPVGFFVPWILFGRLSQEGSSAAVSSTVVVGFGFQPGGMSGQSERCGLVSASISVAQNLERRFAFSFGDGLLGFVPSRLRCIVRHDPTQWLHGFESHPCF